MKYKLEQALSEILRRRAELLKKQERKRIRGLAGASAALFVLLLAAGERMAETLPGELSESVYGAFRLSQSAGGYVLAGVVAFALGVALTLVCLRGRARMKGPDPPDRHERGPTE